MFYSSSIRNFLNNNRGSSTVEFALIIPTLLIATLMIFDLGRVVLAYSSIQDVAADTARYASIHGPLRGGGMSDAEIIAYAEGNIAGLEVEFISTTITWTANKSRGSVVTVDISSGFDFFVTRLLPIDSITLDGTAAMTVL